MNRRKALLMFVALPICANVPAGCLPLLGLVLRGGLLRTFGRAVRAGGSPALSTIGRGVAVSSRAAGLSRVAAANSRIISPTGQTLAETTKRDGGLALVSKGKQLHFSRKQESSLLHYDIFGRYAGRSLQVEKNRINYYSSSKRREKVVSYDLIRRGGRLVKHHDSDGDLVGTSEISTNGKNADISADDGTNEYLDSLFSAKIFSCDEASEQYDRFRDTQRACVAGNETACADVKLERLRLQAIERDCP